MCERNRELRCHSLRNMSCTFLVMRMQWYAVQYEVSSYIANDWKVCNVAGSPRTWPQKEDEYRYLSCKDYYRDHRGYCQTSVVVCNFSQELCTRHALGHSASQ